MMPMMMCVKGWCVIIMCFRGQCVRGKCVIYLTFGIQHRIALLFTLLGWIYVSSLILSFALFCHACCWLEVCVHSILIMRVSVHVFFLLTKLYLGLAGYLASLGFPPALQLSLTLILFRTL